MPPRAKKARGGDGDSKCVSKAERVAALKEELLAHLMRLQIHGAALPQWATHIAAANAAMAGGGVAPLIAGKPRTVATDLIGAVSGTTMTSRFKALSEIIFAPDLQTTGELKKQAETSSKMMIVVTELVFLNDFGDKNGSIQWSNFTKGVADALGQ